MLPALLWSALPAAALGRAKLPLAEALHDKVLHADATMNKADWLTAGAAMIGVLGIGLGLWWADAVAAAVISLDILRDGVTNLRAVVADLLDSEPTTVDHSGPEALPQVVEQRLRSYPWVADVEVRCARRAMCSSARHSWSRPTTPIFRPRSSRPSPRCWPATGGYTIW